MFPVLSDSWIRVESFPELSGWWGQWPSFGHISLCVDNRLTSSRTPQPQLPWRISFLLSARLREGQGPSVWSREGSVLLLWTFEQGLVSVSPSAQLNQCLCLLRSAGYHPPTCFQLQRMLLLCSVFSSLCLWVLSCWGDFQREQELCAQLAILA